MTNEPTTRATFGRGMGLAATLLLVGAMVAGAARADLPTERQTIDPLPQDARQRIYIADPSIGHLVDGRLHVIDTARMRYLAMLGTGYIAQSVLSRDRREIYLATTYYARLQRGERTDVVEVYGADDLQLRHEIVIPAKHAQALPIRATLDTTADGRFLLVQNATPASSVTVVDLPARQVVGELPTPGCWGVLPWPKDARRFSTVCGDGTLATIELDDAGAAKPRTPGVRFFDPDRDPVFMHYELSGDTLRFVSYAGQVHALTLVAQSVSAEAPWSFVTPAERKRGWAPGGYQLFTVDAAGERLFVGMHAHKRDGSHKNPAEQIWEIDLKRQQRVDRSPGFNAVAMTMTRGAPPRLVVLDGATNGLVALDPKTLGKGKPLGRLDGIGETSIKLEAH